MQHSATDLSQGKTINEGVKQWRNYKNFHGKEVQKISLCSPKVNSLLRLGFYLNSFVPPE